MGCIPYAILKCIYVFTDYSRYVYIYITYDQFIISQLVQHVFLDQLYVHIFMFSFASAAPFVA